MSLTRFHPFVFFLGLTLSLLCLTTRTQAATLTVTNTNDSGAGSLRNTIATASAGDTITFAVTGTITLTSGELLIDKDLMIQGPGANLLTVSGNKASRVFAVNIGVTASLSGLTVSKGQSNLGAGILNEGTLTITNCVLADNMAFRGGGILNFSTLTITNCTIANNSAGGDGGGIVNQGDITVNNCIFSGNSAGSPGGGGLAIFGTTSTVIAVFRWMRPLKALIC